MKCNKCGCIKNYKIYDIREIPMEAKIIRENPKWVCLGCDSIIWRKNE